jgi:hypothetical protein
MSGRESGQAFFIVCLYMHFRWRSNYQEVVQWLACSPQVRVDSGFETRSGQTKDYKIGICFFSAKHTTLR